MFSRKFSPAFLLGMLTVMLGASAMVYFAGNAGLANAAQPQEPLPAASNSGEEPLFDSPVSEREQQLLDSALYESPLVISAADFSNDGNNSASDWFFLFSGGHIKGVSTGLVCMQAPVYVPDEVTITDLFVTIYDNVTDGRIFVNLYRFNNFAGGPADTLGSVLSSEANAVDAVRTIASVDITNGVVDYPTYAYYLGMCLDKDVLLYSARIYYSTPE